MSDRCSFINLDGKKVYFMNFSGLKSKDEIVSYIEEAKSTIRTQGFSSVIGLTSIEDMHFNNEIKDIFSEFTKANKPYMKCSAVVGVDSLQRIIYNGVMRLTGREIKIFDKLDDAKQWLKERAN